MATGRVADEQDDFAVKDDKGVPVVIVKGKAMSWRDRKSELRPSMSSKTVLYTQWRPCTYAGY
jgi:hypothetical protein